MNLLEIFGGKFKFVVVSSFFIESSAGDATFLCDTITLQVLRL